MKVRLVKVYTEVDDHAVDIEMFRVYKDVDLLIEPKQNHKIVLDAGSFFVNRIEQNLKEGMVYLYEDTDIPHYEFWSDEDRFRKKYLPTLIEEGWDQLYIK